MSATGAATPLWVIVLIIRQLIPDKTTPYLVWLPNRVQVTLCLGLRNALMQNPVKKHERRNPHVGGAMDKHLPPIESLHHPVKSTEILG